MENEVPTIDKIMNSNITKSDKKRCLRLYEQLYTYEENSADYYRTIDSINEILNKSNIYTKEEIKFLEKEEEKLRKNVLFSG